MRATVDRKALKDTLTHAKRIAGGRVTLPALSGVRLEARGGAFEVIATDLEVTMHDELSADGTDDGAVLVNCRMLHTLVGKLDGDRVTFAVADDGRRVEVSDGEAELSLRTLVLEDFPTPGDFDFGMMGAVMPTDRLKAVLQAASTDDTRPVLTAVRLDGEAREMVATDSYRMMRGMLESSPAEPFSALIPARALKLVTMGKPADTIGVRSDGAGHVELSAGGERRWVVREQGGAFPNYQALWPDTAEGTVTVDAKRLAKAADRIGAIALGQANTPVSFGPNGASAKVSAYNQEMGEASEKVPAIIDGDCCDIAFNPKFLQAMADAADGQVTIGLRDGLKPATFQLGNGLRGLLMPMKVN